jgi:hypothetical protein
MGISHQKERKKERSLINEEILNTDPSHSKDT